MYALLKYKIQKRYMFIDKSILFKENNQTLSLTKTTYETNNQQMFWHAFLSSWFKDFIHFWNR